MRSCVFACITLFAVAIALPGCTQVFAPRGTWIGTAVLVDVRGASDSECRPNWWEKPGDDKEVLVSFNDVRSKGAVYVAVPKDFAANWYQLSVRPFRGEVTLERLLGDPYEATLNAQCKLTLVREAVTGELRDDRFVAVMTQRWRNTAVDGEFLSVRYDLRLHHGVPTTGSPLAGVWHGTPRLHAVESDNKCIAEAHDHWGHRENPATFWIRGESAELRADMLDFTAFEDCQYSGRVSDDGTFMLTSGDGACGGGTRVDECGPGTGFQMQSKLIKGHASGNLLIGQIVETWSLHEEPHTPIVVTYQFGFKRVGER